MKVEKQVNYPPLRIGFNLKYIRYLFQRFTEISFKNILSNDFQSFSLHVCKTPFRRVLQSLLETGYPKPLSSATPLPLFSQSHNIFQ
jgi:hypothetical protein